MQRSLIIFFLVILIFLYIKYFSMIHLSGYRGVIGGRSLQRKIYSSYKNSSTIKIKVTRGFNLFACKSGLFHNLFFNNKFNSNKKVKILLHYPCIESEHIIKRSKANQKTPEKYIEDIFYVLKEFKQHTESQYTDKKIEVKFYREQYVNWRCYIFKKSGSIMNCFYSGYFTNVSGVKSKMLSMIGKKTSFSNSLDHEFDQIFNVHSFELVSNTIDNNELLHTNICGHPGCEGLMKKSYDKIFN